MEELVGREREMLNRMDSWQEEIGEENWRTTAVMMK